MADGSDYAVTVLTLPSSPNQSCSVTAGNGTVSGADIIDVAISCVTTSYPRFAYVANATDSSVSTYVVNATNGQLKFIGSAATGTLPYSVTVDPSGQYAYVPNGGSDDVSQYTIGIDGSLITQYGTPSAPR